MKFQKLILVLALLPSLAYSQIINLYFEIGKYTSPHHAAQLDSLFRKGIKVIKIQAYADFLGDSVKNERLSEKRAKTLLALITKKQAQMPQIVTYGERFSTQNQSASEGQPEFRKVSIEYIPVSKSHVPELKIVDQKIELPFLEFVPGSHRIMEQSKPVLEQAVKFLISKPDLKIRIEGHICCLDDKNSDGYDFDTNEWSLSLNRAKTIYDYFSAAGISQERMSYKGFGAQFPKVKPENNEYDRQRNRRVELRILE